MDIKLQPNITGTNVNLVRGATQADLTNAVNNAKTYRDEAQAFSIVSEDKSIESAYSALNASVSATTAIDKANIATNKATEANNSAINASASEAVCIAKATIATDKADIATAQSVIATDKANEASVSANTATTQAGIATTKASEASTSASNALTSENNADTSEANALIYRNQAESFANSINPSDLVHISGTETITGNKTFSGTVSGLTKATVGLSNVDNTSDANKPISTATQTALNTKVDKVTSTDNAVVRFNGTTGEVQNSAITIDDSGNIGSGTQSFNGFGGSGFKNYIINPTFKVNQYNRLPCVAATNSVYIDGNWRCANNSTGTLTLSADTITYQGTTYPAVKATATTAITLGTDTRYFAFGQSLEANNISSISNKNMCVSFLFECSRAGKYSVAIIKVDSTSGIGQKTYITSFTATVGVQQVIIPIPADSYQVLPSINVGIGIQIGFVTSYSISISSVDGWMDGAKYMKSDALAWGDTAGAYIKATDIILEPGLIKTPSESRPYGLELSLCQRYYETSGTARCEEFRNTTTNSTQYGAVRFNVQKRTSPTVIVYSDNFSTANNVAEGNGNNVPCSLTSIGDTGFRLSWTNTPSTFGASFIYTASAEL